MESLTGAYQNIMSDDTENDSSEIKKKDKGNADTLADNSGNSLEYLKGKFGEISTSKISKMSKAEEDLRSAIRYLCLNFLLMLLIGKVGREEFKNGGMNFLNDGLTSMSGFGERGMILDGGSIQLSKITDTETLEHYEGEFEGTTFSSKGIVKTSDGREIDFNIDLTMSRSFESYTKETGTYESFGMRLVDPLVINLDTCAAEVSDQKFYFDLDADGIEDETTTLSSNSGFLALDKNEDGVINDGSELFGTKSGDGFKDLMAYDSDGNGWIDEADEIFDKLKIFCINEDGSTLQYSLKDKGVGAIYLGSRDTEFSVTNKMNMVNAQIRKTGMFLYESGAAGTIQHVDLACELGA